MKCEYRIAEATREHFMDLIPNLQGQHLEDILAGGRVPERALLETFYLSPICWTAVDCHGVVAIWGVAVPSALCGFGSLWLIGTDRMVCKAYVKPFLREARKFLSYARARFPVLVAHQRVTTANERWLEWLGLELHGYVTCNGEEYLQLVMAR